MDLRAVQRCYWTNPSSLQVGRWLFHSALLYSHLLPSRPKYLRDEQRYPQPSPHHFRQYVPHYLFSPNRLFELTHLHSPHSRRFWHRYHSPGLLCPLRHHRIRRGNSRKWPGLHVHHDIFQRDLDWLPGHRRLGHWALLPGSNYGSPSAFPARRCLIHHRDPTL